MSVAHGVLFGLTVSCNATVTQTIRRSVRLLCSAIQCPRPRGLGVTRRAELTNDREQELKICLMKDNVLQLQTTFQQPFSNICYVQ